MAVPLSPSRLTSLPPYMQTTNSQHNENVDNKWINDARASVTRVHQFKPFVVSRSVAHAIIIRHIFMLFIQDDDLRIMMGIHGIDRLSYFLPSTPLFTTLTVVQ